MAVTDRAVDGLVELGNDRRPVTDVDADLPSPLRTGLTFGGGILAAAGVVAALEGLSATPAFAASSPDVRMLQTAASIEVLAVATYKTALTLPFIGGSSANPVVQGFAMTTMQQHQEHLAAFNAGVTRLGGTAQTAPDPALAKVVQAAVPGLTSPGPVVALALELEQGRPRPTWLTWLPVRRGGEEAHRVRDGGRGPARVGAPGRPGPAGRGCTAAHRAATGRDVPARSRWLGGLP